MAAPRRLAELDALRGIAALMVVLFHFTTRYDELYGHATAPLLSLAWGHYGVNLFFMISGFVIFMTLERTRRPLDFVVSRFSRLYPAYWVAVALTFGVVSWLGLPGKEVGLPAALANLSMVHSLAGVPSVDGVYWTLEVELLFYAWALLVYRLGLLGKVHLLFGLLLLGRLAYHVAAEAFHIDLPWIAYRLLILKFIPWFIAGVMVYRLAGATRSARRDLALLAAAVLLLGVVERPAMGLLAAALAALLYGAASGRLALLAHPLLAWFGAISYTLYLVHENIGWALLLRAEAAGIDSNLAIALVLAFVIALAALLTRLVEQPAMAAIRRAWKRRGEGAPLASNAPT